MPSHNKSNIILPLGCTLAAYFVLCRLAFFLSDAWSITLPVGTIYIALAACAIAAFTARGAISAYLNIYKNPPLVTAIIYIISAVFCILCTGIVTADCAGGYDILKLAGGWLLLGCVANIVTSNIAYAASRSKKLKLKKSDILLLMVILILLNLQAVVYCRFIKHIFIWDNAGYFTMVHKLDEIFPSAEYIKTVYRSIFTTDYNYIIAIPANIMCALFGKSRMVFVLSIINFYVFPIYAVVYLISKSIFNISKAKFVCTILAFPYIIFAANTGFIDIGCVLPALVAAVLYIYCDKDKTSWLCGILLALCILMRRWYSFWSLSLVVAAIMQGITTRKIKPALELTSGCAFVLLFFTQSFVSGKLLADYGSMYSAYSLGIRYDILLFTRYFGIILPITAIGYSIYKAVICTKHHQKCPEVFLTIQLSVCFTLFVYIQTHGQQHLALYVPALMLIMLSGASAINKRHLAIPIAAVCILHTANTFVPRIQPTAITQIKHPALLPNYSAYPPVDHDVQNILDVTEYMDREIGMSDKTVCLLASSLKLNYETLSNAEISLSVTQSHGIDRSTYYLPISDIDNRDGLSHNLFDADYILVPSSLQIHLAEEEQQVISVPYRHITEKTGFATAYEKEDISFDISEGLQLSIYRRTRDVTSEEKRQIYAEIFGN